MVDKAIHFDVWKSSAGTHVTPLPEGHSEITMCPTLCNALLDPEVPLPNLFLQNTGKDAIQLKGQTSLWYKASRNDWFQAIHLPFLLPLKSLKEF